MTDDEEKQKGKWSRHRANPDFGRAGIKVQGALFVDFGKRIGRRKNLHTDFRSAGEDLRIFGDLWAIGSEPSHVDSLDAISGRHRALRQGSTPRQKLIQKMDNVTLATRVLESWRRAHNDVAMTIGLNPIRELRKGWVRQDFGPTLEVELGMRNALGISKVIGTVEATPGKEKMKYRTEEQQQGRPKSAPLDAKAGQTAEMVDAFNGMS